jgi:hypothetical protein
MKLKEMPNLLDVSARRQMQKESAEEMVRVETDMSKELCHAISPVAALDVLGLKCGATNAQLIEAYKSKAVEGPDGEFITEKINKQAFDVLAEFGTNHKRSKYGFAHIVGCENPFAGIHVRAKLVKAE